MTAPSPPPPDPPLEPRARLARTVATAAIAVALALVASLIGERYGAIAGSSGPYVLFTVAVVVSAVRGGFGAGVFATLLAALATGFFHLDPLYSLRVASADEAALLALFLLEGIVLSAVSPAIGRGSIAAELGPARGYATAVGAVATAAAVKLLFAPAVAPETTPFMLFYAAVMLAAWAGGPGPGVLATVLAVAAAAFLFLTPRYDFRVADPVRAGQLSLFLFEGGVLSVFSRALAVAKSRAAEHERSALRYWAELWKSELRLRRQNEMLVALARRPAPPTAELADAVRELTQAATATLDVQRASVWVFDAPRRTLRCLGLYDRTAGHSTGQELRVEDYPRYFQAVEGERAVAAHDAITDPRTSEFAAAYLGPLGITSMLDAPIRVGGELTGVVCLEHVGPPRRWAADEEQFAGSVGDFVALAVKRQELRAADDRIREQAALLDQAHDAIVALDPAGRVRFWNGGAEHLYGRSAADVLGQSVDAYVRPPGTDCGDLDRGLAATGEWTGEMRHRTHDGREVTVAVRWTAVRTADGADGRLMIATDVTDRKAMEVKLARGQRMESLGALASGIAHDLNNLLTPVLMGADLLQGEDSPTMRASLLGTMRTSAERAAALLRQILSFAKGSAPDSGPVDVRAVVRQVADLLAHTLPKSIAFHTDVSAETWAVRGPASKIDQVLMNLCVNARDAMPGGGDLVLTATNSDLGPGAEDLPADVPPGQYVALAVRDTGSGIPPDVLPRIFDPFFTTKEPGKGTGLGLATTREIVAGLGGFVRVDSAVGRGTCFEVYVPAVAVPGPAAAADSKEMPIGWGELVLVVDDEASIRELAARILETYGYRVATAGDGGEAVARCREAGADLRVILLDVLMPGQELSVTLADLRTAAPAVPVVLTTGVGGQEAEAPNVGETAFLPKPYTASLLLRTVRKVLGPPTDRR